MPRVRATALVALATAAAAFQRPHHALRQPSRRAADDDFDFDAAFKARVEEVQQLDVAAAVFGEDAPLDLEKMAKLGGEAVVIGAAAIVGSLLLLFSGIYFGGSKSPLKEAEPVFEDPGVCLSGKCANGAPKVKALEFNSDRFSDERAEARAANPEPFLE